MTTLHEYDIMNLLKITIIITTATSEIANRLKVAQLHKSTLEVQRT